MENSLGLKFGYGVFETIRYNQELIYFDDHMKRLNKSLKTLHMKTVNACLIKEAALSYLEETDYDGIRISVYEDQPPIITYEGRYRDPKGSYRVIVSEQKRFKDQPLNYIKSSAHLGYFLEKKALRAKGIDEAIHLNENNHVTEGIYTNVFFVKEHKILTPAIECGLLPGVYRAQVIKVCKRLNIIVEEGYYDIDDILGADDVFMTNALIGIKSVHQIEAVSYKRHPMVQRLIEEMEDGCKKNCL